MDFFYAAQDLSNAEKFWAKESKDWADAIERYIGKNRKGVMGAVTETVAAGDDSETKLRKLYARAQKIRNLSYERDKSAAEAKKEKLKDHNHVDDVLKFGYGYRSEINRLFIAMARQAGFEANAVRSSTRDGAFFNQGVLFGNQLETEISWVKTPEGKEYWLDPGTPYCPFGLMEWKRTGVIALKVGKDLKNNFVRTPVYQPDQALSFRKADLTFEDGIYKGKVQLTFNGLEGLRRKMNALEDDEAAVRKDLENELKRNLPGGTKVTLEQVTGYTSTEEPVVVVAAVEIPEMGSATGQRLMTPLGVFQGQDQHPFQKAERKHAIYFRNAFQELDEVNIKYPANLKVENLPKPRSLANDFGSYQISWSANGDTLTLRRELTIKALMAQPIVYPLVRSFFDQVTTGDQQVAVLRVSREVAREAN